MNRFVLAVLLALPPILDAVNLPFLQSDGGVMVFSDEQWTEPEQINLSIEDYTAIHLDKPFIKQLKTLGLWNEARKLMAEFQRTTKETIEKKCSMDSVARLNRQRRLIPALVGGSIGSAAVLYLLYKNNEFENKMKEQAKIIKQQYEQESVRHQFEVAFAQFTQRQLSELYSVIDGHIPVGFPMPDGQKSSNLLDIKMSNISCFNGKIFATVERTFALSVDRHQLHNIQPIGQFDKDKKHFFTPILPSLAYETASGELLGLDALKCKSLSSTVTICHKNAKKVDCLLSTIDNCDVIVENVQSPFVRVHDDFEQFKIMTDEQVYVLNERRVLVPSSGLFTVQLQKGDTLQIGPTVLFGSSNSATQIVSNTSPNLFRVSETFAGDDKIFVAKLRDDGFLDLVEKDAKSLPKTVIVISAIAVAIGAGISLLATVYYVSSWCGKLCFCIPHFCDDLAALKKTPNM